MPMNSGSGVKMKAPNSSRATDPVEVCVKDWITNASPSGSKSFAVATITPCVSTSMAKLSLMAMGALFPVGASLSYTIEANTCSTVKPFRLILSWKSSGPLSSRSFIISPLPRRRTSRSSSVILKAVRSIRS